MATKIIAPARGLSDGFIRNLKPQDKRFDVADPACSGLRIRVGTSGKKSFIWFYKDADTKKLKMITLGRYGTGDDQLSLAEARKALDAAKQKLSTGELSNPTGATPKTVAELCAVFYKARILPHRRAPEAVLQVIEHDIIPIIGNKNIATLSTVAVTRVVSVVVDRGATTHAGKVTAILKQLFKFAEGRGFIDRSPAYALDKKDLGVVTTQRKRWLATDELKPVWDAISNAPRLSLPTTHGLKILLLAGVRTGELLQAEWQHIDFDNATWFIPAENTKTEAEWTVPLTPGVIALLKDLQGLDPVYVCPGKAGPLTDKVFGRAMKRLFDKQMLTIDPVTPHDFRRTLRTHLEALNVDAHIAEKCLNHSLGAINQTYNKNLYLTERREALERWADFVDRQVNPQPNVIPVAFQEAG